MSAENENKPSPVEGHKSQSRHLRGTLAEEFADTSLDHLSDMNKSLIKFHGSYQQEDRDARKNRAKPGVGKAYMFMIRLKLPGGRLTADQYLAMDDIAGQYGNATLRITTRGRIAAILELDPDEAQRIDRVGADEPQPRRAGDGYFERDRDVAFHLLGRLARVLGDDFDDGRRRIRVGLDVQRGKRGIAHRKECGEADQHQRAA